MLWCKTATVLHHLVRLSKNLIAEFAKAVLQATEGTYVHLLMQCTYVAVLLNSCGLAGLVYQALGFPPQFFTVLFAIPRVTGYLAHWRESLSDPDTKILRPQQDYRVCQCHTCFMTVMWGSLSCR